jgi:hypothetical protein
VSQSFLASCTTRQVGSIRHEQCRRERYLGIPKDCALNGAYKARSIRHGRDELEISLLFYSRLPLTLRSTIPLPYIMALTSAINATMRAVLWEGNAYNVTVAEVPRPTIINATDAIVKLSRAAICGSDLHIYRGTNPGPATPWILGHEGVGYVSEIGEGVGSLSVGDSVIIPFTTAEGHVHTSLTTQMYGGYGNGGGMGGTQGQY